MYPALQVTLRLIWRLMASKTRMWPGDASLLCRPQAHGFEDEVD